MMTSAHVFAVKTLGNCIKRQSKSSSLIFITLQSLR
jgi:hypothetical protein